MPEDQIKGANTLEKADVERIGATLSQQLEHRTALIEQKVDLKMDGLQREISAKLDDKPGNGALILHSIAIIGVILAVLALAGERFSGGMSATGALAQQIVEHERKYDAIMARLNSITEAKDDLVKESPRDRKTPDVHQGAGGEGGRR